MGAPSKLPPTWPSFARKSATILAFPRNTVVLAVCSNTVVKAVMAMVLGGKAMGIRVVAVSAGMLIAGIVVVVVS